MQRLLMLVPTATYRAEAFVLAAQNQGVDVTIASEEPSTMSEHRPLDLVTLDFSEPGACAREMLEFSNTHPIDGVIGIDDQVIAAASAIASALSLPHNPIEAASATRNKHTMRKHLEASGVSQPGFQLFPTDADPQRTADSVSYPCVIKPLMMSASRGVIRADSPGEFTEAFRRVSAIVGLRDAPVDEASRTQLLVEDYVPGWEVAVEGVLTDGECHIFTIFEKPDPLEGPYFPETIYLTPAELPVEIQRRIGLLTQHAVRALGLVEGPIHAEIRGMNDQLMFIEVAARSIGGYCSRVLRFEGGLSLEEVIIRHALRMDPEIPAIEARPAGVMMLQSPQSGLFEEALGVERARAVPNIDEVLISAHPGQMLSPLPEGFLYLGFIFARADSSEAVEEALRAAHASIEFVIEPMERAG